METTKLKQRIVALAAHKGGVGCPLTVEDDMNDCGEPSRAQQMIRDMVLFNARQLRLDEYQQRAAETDAAPTAFQMWRALA